jgi:uncharacterized protein YjdB
MLRKRLVWFLVVLIMFLQINNCIYIFAEQTLETPAISEGELKGKVPEDTKEEVTKGEGTKEEKPKDEGIKEEESKEDAAKEESTSQENFDEEGKNENEESKYIKVTDIDIADYRSSMEEDEKQLLMVTVLPLDATNQKVKYYSSKESVATINEIGRITAIDSGTTQITIEAADGVSRQFKLKVNSPKSTHVSVLELDLGNYQEEMRVGENQVLSVTVLPFDATDKTIQYTSSDEKVASVNGIGRIKANSEGETVITARAGSKKNSFTLKVLPKKDTSVKDIDLGDYIKRMKVGETQLLMPAVLPPDAVNPGFKYVSKNTEVATVNSLGRIRTHKVGTSVIIIEAGGVMKQFTLTVYEEKEVKVTNMDLGDYQKTMKVGEKQLLSPSVWPIEASDRKITYKSSNEEIATVNVFGRIQAQAVGETKIIVSVDGIEKFFDLKVEENKNYPVEDIDIGKYDEKMEAGKTQKLQVTVLPYNATEPKVEYISEDHKIATIDTSGEIKAVKEGTVVINIKAGEVTKQISIYVVTATEKIEINKSYIVLKANEQFKLKCSVLPRNANQKIEFKANDTSIAKVDGNGLITAVDTGVATVIVSNGYMQSEVTVLVNKDLIEEVEEDIPAVSINNDMDPLTEILKESHDMKVVVGKSKFDRVTKSALKYLYDSKRTLLIDGNEYLIIIDGNDIVNYRNEISTNIECSATDDGTEVIVNDGDKLPGKIGISFEEQNLQNARYIYLYNESKGKYEILKNAIESGTIKVDIGGKYLLTDRELSFLKVNLSVIIIGSFGFLTVIFSYIFVKKKYWFW